MIVAYVSGHGFGHATRVGQVLRRLREQSPETKIGVVSAAPEALFRSAISGPFEFRKVDCDVGVAQRDALTIDEGETLQRWNAFVAREGDLVDSEWRYLHHSRARLVLGDIPPLAFLAAHEAGIPALALANFSWDWIYNHLARRQVELREAARRCARAYGWAEALFRLPFHGEMTAFAEIVDVPLVARRPRTPRADARRRLGLDHTPAVLLSFGGIGLPSFDAAVLAPLHDLRFVAIAREVEVVAPNVMILDPGRIASLGLYYEDLVGAVDVVLTKPGYGIVSDAIGAGTRVVYTDRGDFPEYPILAQGMAQHVPAAYVSHQDLFEGRIGDAIRSVLAQPVPAPPNLGGAEIVAARLLEWL